LYGDRDLYGEIVFEGEEVASIRSASVEDISVEVIHSENRTGIIYTHLHNMEFVLKIRIG
jgi:hypothetical protein